MNKKAKIPFQKNQSVCQKFDHEAGTAQFRIFIEIESTKHKWHQKMQWEAKEMPTRIAQCVWNLRDAER